MLKLIELFSGAGGIALGFSRAGLYTEMLVEIDKDSASTLKNNRSEWNIVNDDIKNVSFREYRDYIDVVAGGFPCQSFSYSGKKLGFKDERGSLFFEFIRCVKEVNPKIILMENVKGLLSNDNGKTFKIMLNDIRKSGYKPFYKVINAKYFNVPQSRERLIIISIRNDLNFEAIFPSESNDIINLKDAIYNCPTSDYISYSKNKKKYLNLIPEGGNWKDLPSNLQKEYLGKSFYAKGGKTGMAKRLSWDLPSPTLLCCPSQKFTERCHPVETRPLTIREYARIQTFPDYWIFKGSLSSQYRQIGNAVPVELAFQIGKSIVKMLGNETKI